MLFNTSVVAGDNDKDFGLKDPVRMKVLLNSLPWKSWEILINDVYILKLYCLTMPIKMQHDAKGLLDTTGMMAVLGIVFSIKSQTGYND